MAPRFILTIYNITILLLYILSPHCDALPMPTLQRRTNYRNTGRIAGFISGIIVGLIILIFVFVFIKGIFSGCRKAASPEDGEEDKDIPLEERPTEFSEGMELKNQYKSTPHVEEGEVR